MAFKKGQSGNPAGRPADGKSWAAVLDKLCDEEVKAGSMTMTKKEAICRKLLKLASEGERWAIEALMDRIDGKPKQVSEVDHTTGHESFNKIERVIVKN